MRKKKSRRNRLPGGIFVILLTFAVFLNNFAAADAENTSLWESSGEYVLTGEQSAGKTSGMVGSLSDNLVIVEEEIDLTDEGPRSPGKTEGETEFEIKIEIVPETEIMPDESEAKKETEAGTEVPSGEPGMEPGAGGMESAGEMSGAESGMETEAGSEAEIPEEESESETGTEMGTETGSETEEISKEPGEELRELLKQTVQDGKNCSAIAQYLGLEELEKAIAEKGMTFELRVEPSKGILQKAGFPGWIRENYSCKLRMQMDPVRKQWMLDAGVILMDQDVFRSTLYGNKEMLTLSVPQLYEKPLGIRSGNLYEQLKNSWAADAAEKIPSDERDFELKFFPDEETLKMWKDELRELYGYEENIERQYEELLNTFLENLTCTKEKERDEIVYSIEMEMDAARELYLGWFDLYYRPMKTLGKVTEYEFDQVRTELEKKFDEFEKTVPENPSVKCHVKDNRLERITGTVFVDPPGAAGQLVNVDGSSASEALRKKSLEFEIVLWEELAGIESTDINFYVRDEEQEAIYYCNLFSGRFDSATGHCDLTFSLTDQENGAETTVQVGSRFTDVIPGESFVWDIDRIVLEQSGDSAELLKGQLCVQARPEDPVQPENPVMLFDLPEEELQQTGGTIAKNLIRLFGTGSEKETEKEKMDELTDKNPGGGEMTEEEAETESESEAKIVIFQ